MRFLTIFLVSLIVSGTYLDLGGCAETASKTTNNQDVLRTFQQAMWQAIDKEKRYPYGASGRAKGKVVIDFDYTAGGKADNFEIVESSGDASLDHAALMAVYFAQLPPEPQELQGIKHFTVEVDFGMH